MDKLNIYSVVCNGLCVSCGLCVDVCPKRCLSIQRGRNNVFPKIDENECVNCGKCFNVCPGVGVDIKRLSESYFGLNEGGQFSPCLGYYHKCFSGYSCNYDIRFHSASGGILTSLLCFLFDKKYIDGAVVVKMSDKNPLQPKSFIAKTKEEVIDSKGSKYCIVSYEDIITQMLIEKGKYIVVGLPCLIHGFRKYEEIDKRLSSYVYGYFGLLCSSTRILSTPEYLCYRYDVNVNDVNKFEFRGNGYLGYMTMYAKNDDVLFKIPYEKYWRGMRGFFNFSRCSLCIDHFAELSDVSFGDLFVGDNENERIGINSIISRSEKWTNILMEAKLEGYVHFDEISSDELLDSQPYALKQKKGNGVVNAIKTRSLLRKETPKYDIPLNGMFSMKGFLFELIKIMMRKIGKVRQLWWIVKELDKRHE